MSFQVDLSHFRRHFSHLDIIATEGDHILFLILQI